MNNITVIYGMQGTGKSLKAEALTKDKKVLWTKQKSWARDLKINLDSETQVIVVDDVLSGGFARGLTNIISIKFVKPNKLFGGFYQLEIDLPDIIIISQVLSKTDFEGIERDIVFYDMSKEVLI